MIVLHWTNRNTSALSLSLFLRVEEEAGSREPNRSHLCAERTASVFPLIITTFTFTPNEVFLEAGCIVDTKVTGESRLGHNKVHEHARNILLEVHALVYLLVTKGSMQKCPRLIVYLSFSGQ